MAVFPASPKVAYLPPEAYVWINKQKSILTFEPTSEGHSRSFSLPHSRCFVFVLSLPRSLVALSGESGMCVLFYPESRVSSLQLHEPF